MKKRYFSGLPVLLILALGFVLAGCPTDASEEQDTWSNVTSLNQIDGTWKGSYGETRDFKDFLGDSWDENSMAPIFGNMKVTASAEINITIHASAKTQAMSIKTTMAFSGGNIDAVWTLIKQNMVEPGAEVTFNDANHSISMTYGSQTAQPISDAEIAEMLAQGIQINQNGTKIKIPAGQIGDGSPEVILAKQ
jgi:hypothetical protein